MSDSSDSLLQRLQARRQEQVAVAQFSRQQVWDWAQALLGLLFSHFEDPITPPEQIPERLAFLQSQLATLVKRLGADPDFAVRFFRDDLNLIELALQADARSINAGDPAAGCTDEVILAYPGFLAVAFYRMAHVLYSYHLPLIPRLITEYAHQLTGVDIHPGAKIGQRFCIDHGTGVVIGESAEIGDDVKIYQGVTLGALSVSKDLAHTKRHPTIESGVVIYANATILGGETRIGHDSIIGGNVWLTRSVEPYSAVYHRADIQVRSQLPTTTLLV